MGLTMGESVIVGSRSLIPRRVESKAKSDLVILKRVLISSLPTLEKIFESATLSLVGTGALATRQMIRRSEPSKNFPLAIPSTFLWMKTQGVGLFRTSNHFLLTDLENTYFDHGCAFLNQTIRPDFR